MLSINQTDFSSLMKVQHEIICFLKKHNCNQNKNRIINREVLNIMKQCQNNKEFATNYCFLIFFYSFTYYC